MIGSLNHTDDEPQRHKSVALRGCRLNPVVMFRGGTSRTSRVDLRFALEGHSHKRVGNKRVSLSQPLSVLPGSLCGPFSASRVIIIHYTHSSPTHGATGLGLEPSKL